MKRSINPRATGPPGEKGSDPLSHGAVAKPRVTGETGEKGSDPLNGGGQTPFRLTPFPVLTPRERMRRAMMNRTPDCVPCMPQICPPHAIRALGLDFRRTLIETVLDPGLMNRLDYECAKLYGVDGMRLAMTGEPTPKNEIREEGGLIWRVDPRTGERKARLDLEGGGGWIALDEAPELRDEADIDRRPCPSSREVIASGRLDSARRIIEAAGDTMFMAAWGPMVSVEYLTFVRGKEQALMDLMERPEFCHRALEKQLEIAIQAGIAMAQVGIEAIMIGETFGGVIGPRLFREFCLPYMRRYVEALRPHGVVLYLHICGNSTALFELMAETGVDCIEPLDPLGGVCVADAKRRVGKRVALMGGVHTLKLAHGSLRDVEEDCARCLTEGAPGGGYVLACGDMLPTETAPEKVRAMVKAAHRFRYAT